MMGSLSGLLQTLCEVLGPKCNILEWASYKDILHKVQRVVLPPLQHSGKHRDAMRTAFVSPAAVVGSHETMKAISALRSIGLQNYVSLGRKMGLRYGGLYNAIGILDSTAIPLSVFHSGALKETPSGHVRSGPLWQAVEDGGDRSVEDEQPSYYNLHMRLQRRQPTLQNLKAVIRELQHEEPDVVLSGLSDSKCCWKGLLLRHTK